MRDYTSTIRDLNPFPWIFKSNYKVNFEEIEDKVLDYIKTVDMYGSISNVCNVDGTQKHEEPHKWEEFEYFVKKKLGDNIIEIWENWNLSKSYIPSILRSHISQGNNLRTHYHQNTTIVCILYLYVPEHSGRLLIQDPMDIYNHSRPLDNTETRWTHIDVKTNDVLLFPGFIKHRNEPGPSKYAVSFDIG